MTLFESLLQQFKDTRTPLFTMPTPDPNPSAAPSAQPHPLATLPREDLDLICALVLHSGSLKDLAAEYDVSYPTIRGRLDKVIERLRARLDGQPADPLSDMLADLVERGEITLPAAKRVREFVRTTRGQSSSGEPT
jgi:hypothetical protein